MTTERRGLVSTIVANSISRRWLVFFVAALVFVWRSFYAMRIEAGVRTS